MLSENAQLPRVNRVILTQPVDSRCAKGRKQAGCDDFTKPSLCESNLLTGYQCCQRFLQVRSVQNGMGSDWDRIAMRKRVLSEGMALHAAYRVSLVV